MSILSSSKVIRQLFESGNELLPGQGKQEGIPLYQAVEKLLRGRSAVLPLVQSLTLARRSATARRHVQREYASAFARLRLASLPL